MMLLVQEFAESTMTASRGYWCCWAIGLVDDVVRERRGGRYHTRMRRKIGDKSRMRLYSQGRYRSEEDEFFFCPLLPPLIPNVITVIQTLFADPRSRSSILQVESIKGHRTSPIYPADNRCVDLSITSHNSALVWSWACVPLLFLRAEVVGYGI
jgi:hypothetical protein